MPAISPHQAEGPGIQAALALPDAPGIEPGWEILTVAEDRARGKFTAEQLARNDARRESVLAMLAEGMSIAATARAHGMSRNTVSAALRRFGPAIEQRKQSLGAECLDIARLAAERMRDELDQMPRASLPIVLGVLVDKAQLLSGAPTVRVEHTSAPAASFNDWLESVVNVTPQPVGPSETLTQKAPAPGAALAADVVPAALHLAPSGDCLSPALRHSSEGSGVGAATVPQKESRP